MKRILIIDESPAVRETLALILGRDFAVIQQTPEKGPLELAASTDDVDLLIFGTRPGLSARWSNLWRFASRAPFAILFLVDSKFAVSALPAGDQFAYLIKPFNPYELREKVAALLERKPVGGERKKPQTQTAARDLSRFLAYPYVARPIALLAPRFADTRLPILVGGEIGCGQDRIARAIHAIDRHGGVWLSLHGSEVNAESLAAVTDEVSAADAAGSPITFVIEKLERVAAGEQSRLSNFLEEKGAAAVKWRLLATSQVQLLESVYRKEFSDVLYYQFATLSLTLAPLRNRQEDIPALANWFAQHYARSLSLGEVSFSPAAIERLRNYLWFGNLSELETVVARSLAVGRKVRIEEADLIFDVFGEVEIPTTLELEELIPRGEPGREKEIPVQVTPSSRAKDESPPNSLNGRLSELRVLIHELAHELKNPMVTIKTFAQLLGDRYDDETFRARFQDVVDGDIERMDDLLEVMIEFADFSRPQQSRLLLGERLRSTLEEIRSEYSKKQVAVRWKGSGNGREILADPLQLTYVLKNVLVAILGEAKPGSEVEIDLGKVGALELSFVREGARIMPITRYLANTAPADSPLEVLPLRLLLAKQLLERNGGAMVIEHGANERDTLKMEFALA
jgi:DNA-binding NtrC family response regulator